MKLMLTSSFLSPASLVSVLLQLVQLERGCCQTSHIPVLLGAYGASLSDTGNCILMYF